MRPGRTEIRISRSALTHNVKAFRRVIDPHVKLMAVVKSNAYGHGVGECAPVFLRAGADWFGVASLTEALQLRKVIPRAPIAVLSYVDGGASELQVAMQQGVRLPAYTFEQLELYQRIARRAKLKAVVHVKFDTGTTRIGFLPRALPRVLTVLKRLHNVVVEGVYSHFAEVETKQQGFSQAQHECFATLASKLEIALGKNLLKHMDCSAGVLVHPDAHFDIVRVGMSLYGIHTVADAQRVHRLLPHFSLQPALSFRTTVIQVKRIPADTTVGYNRTYRVRKPTTIAVLPIGYWEGVDRKLSNRGWVIINGRRAPIRGRVCMNLTMVEVTGIPSVRVGSVATVLGGNDGQCVPVETPAAQIGTIPYEVVTRLNPLIPRVLEP